MKTKKGFTLIELLIVIALLGALAIGLLATIDPFEQLKKGRDTSTRNTVSEFYNANLRFYAIKGVFPWGTDPTADGVNNLTGSVIATLVSAGELKQRFSDLAGTGNLSKIFLNSTGPESMTVCFRPESKAFKVDPNTVYDVSGGTSLTDCQSVAGGTNPNCYFCIQ